MSDAKPILKRELLAYRADIKNEIFRQIRLMFYRLKVTQKELAFRLAMDEGQLSRCLRGENDMRLETFSDLARALECRLDVRLTPLADVVASNKAQVYSVSQGGAVVMHMRQDEIPAQLDPSLRLVQAVANVAKVAV